MIEKLRTSSPARYNSSRASQDEYRDQPAAQMLRPGKAASSMNEIVPYLVKMMGVQDKENRTISEKEVKPGQRNELQPVPVTKTGKACRVLQPVRGPEQFITPVTPASCPRWRLRFVLSYSTIAEQQT